MARHSRARVRARRSRATRSASRPTREQSDPRCCSTCSSRLGGAAAAGRTMVRSTAAPSRFPFADRMATMGATHKQVPKRPPHGRTLELGRSRRTLMMLLLLLLLRPPRRRRRGRAPRGTGSRQTGGIERTALNSTGVYLNGAPFPRARACEAEPSDALRQQTDPRARATRDAARPARAAWAVQRLLAARW